jgi:hypothetical protein
VTRTTSSVKDSGKAGKKIPSGMLVFFATWCPHYQNEASILSELESPAVYEPSLGPEYGVSGYPTTHVLDEDNEVIGAHSGEAPREVYESWIEQALGSGG